MKSGIEIRGTGSSLPERVISNQYLACHFGIRERDIVRKTGIHERRWAQEKEASSDLATRASRIALNNAGLDAKELDLIVLSSTSPDMMFPSTACILQANLKAKMIPAFDIQASCSGFLFGLSIAENFLKQTRSKNALVVASEVKSRMLNLRDSGTSILFGDGAGAVVLSKSKRKEGILSINLHSDGTKHDYIQLRAGGSRTPPSVETLRKGLHYLEMKGTLVYRSAVLCFGKAIHEALASQAIEMEQIACFIFHQANLRLLEKIIEKYRIPGEKVEMTIQKYGNTSSASLPITLDQAVSKKKLKNGDLLLFASFGGGVTWASALYRW
ncbi:MAG: ketoacyl-ACP synthase III [Nitrospirae bacterium]|nr:ketoacyl-ACP synthase III [Nitrospirota bacterium]